MYIYIYANNNSFQIMQSIFESNLHATRLVFVNNNY